jgi:acyl-[acyl-carrier-protein] desaturase
MKVVSPDYERKFYSLYKDFFDHAEEKRRWNMRTDIPWDEVKQGSIGEDFVAIVESFYAVEMYLPDYTGKLIDLYRRNRGFAWFQANWGYEESKHSRTLEEWLVRSGHRTERQMEDLADRLLQKEWTLPHETPRQMFLYTTLQEAATQVNYLGLEKICREAKDAALSKALLFIASDEGNHHRFFADVVKLYMEEDRAGTIEDFVYVLSKFEMPAHHLIPNWNRYGKLIEDSGIYTGKVFVRRVLFPTMERLGVTRDELKAAQAKLAA